MGCQRVVQSNDRGDVWWVGRWWLICSSLLFHSFSWSRMKRLSTDSLRIQRRVVLYEPNHAWLLVSRTDGRTIDPPFLESCSGFETCLIMVRSYLTRLKSQEIIFINFQVSSQNKILTFSKTFHHVLRFPTQVSTSSAYIRPNKVVGGCLLARTHWGMFLCSFQ